MLLLNACGHCLAGNAFWTAGLLEALSSELWALSSGLWVLSSELWTLESSELCIVFMSSELWALSSGELLLLLYSTWQSKSGVFQHCLRTFLVCLSTFLHAFLCAFILHSSTACVHFNYFRALFACIFIGISVYRTQYSGLSEKCLNAVGMHAHSAGTRQGCAQEPLVRIYTVFQHCLRAFLLLSNTLCVHFYCFLLHFHFYSIMFLVWIGPKNAIEMHSRYLTAVLVIHFKQNSHQEVCFMKQNMHTPCFMSCFILALTLFLVLTLFLAFTHVCILILLIQALFWLHLHNVPVLILLKINDTGPYGIHLTRHHVDFLTLGSMCLLIFIISTLTFRSRSC